MRSSFSPLSAICGKSTHSTAPSVVFLMDMRHAAQSSPPKRTLIVARRPSNLSNAYSALAKSAPLCSLTSLASCALNSTASQVGMRSLNENSGRRTSALIVLPLHFSDTTSPCSNDMSIELPLAS